MEKVKNKIENGFYKFEIKEDKNGNKAVALEDGTHFVVSDKDREVSLLFPRKKFIKFFEEQLKDKDKDYIRVRFTSIEIEAIVRGMGDLYNTKKKNKVKGQKNGS